jgi:hypothetical protein
MTIWVVRDTEGGPAVCLRGKPVEWQENHILVWESDDDVGFETVVDVARMVSSSGPIAAASMETANVALRKRRLLLSKGHVAP